MKQNIKTKSNITKKANNMEIKGFIDISLIDWDQKISSVIFLPNCNLRCPYCYNTPLVLHPEKLPTIPFKDIEAYLQKNKDWIDGVVITGGEPTLHIDLLNLCQKLKKLNLLVKIDTNGANPKIIKELLNKELVDYIAMDIKAPLTKQKYLNASGIQTKQLIGKIKETAHILLKSTIEYEFRTTIVPTIHHQKDIQQICHQIKDCKKYVLQNYKANVETINPNFKNLRPFSEKKMKMFLQTAKKMVLNTIIRG